MKNSNKNSNLSQVNRYIPTKIKNFIFNNKHILSKYLNNDIFNLKMYELSNDGLVIVVDTIIRIAGSRDINKDNLCEIQSVNFHKILHNDYSLYLDYLIENNIVITDGFYIKNNKAKGFKINEKYIDDLEKIIIDNKTFNKRTIKEITKNNIKHKVPTEYIKRYKNDIKIDFDNAIKFMNNSYINQIPDKKGKTLNIYTKTLLNHKLLQLRDNQVWINRSSSNGRVNSNVTTLNGQYKRFITNYNYSLDCTSSQPLCLTILIDLINASKESKQLKESNVKQNIIIPLLSYEYSLLLKQMKYSELQRFFLELGSLKIPNKTELNLYKNLCENGNLYEFFMQKSKEINNTIITRNEAKEIFLIVMYSPNNMPNKFKPLFKTLFPTIYTFILNVKSINNKEARSHKFLSLLLQGIESYIWIEEIAPKLSKMGIHYHTIHDSVIIKKYEDIEKVRYIIKEIFYNYNVKPNICIEDLEGNKINID